MKIETTLPADAPRTVFGVIHDLPLAKRFADAATMDRWLDKHEDHLTVYTIEQAE